MTNTSTESDVVTRLDDAVEAEKGKALNIKHETDLQNRVVTEGGEDPLAAVTVAGSNVKTKGA